MFAYQLFATSRPVTHLRLCCALFLLGAVKSSLFFRTREAVRESRFFEHAIRWIELQSSLRKLKNERVLKKRESFHFSITVDTSPMYISEYSLYLCRNLDTFAKYWIPSWIPTASSTFYARRSSISNSSGNSFREEERVFPCIFLHWFPRWKKFLPEDYFKYSHTDYQIPTSKSIASLVATRYCNFPFRV